MKITTIAALFLLPLFTVACDGPPGACEDKVSKTCNDGKKANCTWSEGKISKEEAEKITRDHAFNEGKTCSDLGYQCAGGVCKK
jgi:hypothetical protein